jgi:hypothetical protein
MCAGDIRYAQPTSCCDLPNSCLRLPFGRCGYGEKGGQRKSSRGKKATAPGHRACILVAEARHHTKRFLLDCLGRVPRATCHVSGMLAFIVFVDDRNRERLQTLREF